MENKRKTLNKRAIASIGLFASLIMLLLSAVLTHVMHGNSISHIWLHIHVVFGILFTIFGILHITYNWKNLRRYMSKNQ